jgi:hypothetical protein
VRGYRVAAAILEPLGCVEKFLLVEVSDGLGARCCGVVTWARVAACSLEVL